MVVTATIDDNSDEFIDEDDVYEWLEDASRLLNEVSAGVVDAVSGLTLIDDDSLRDAARRAISGTVDLLRVTYMNMTDVVDAVMEEGDTRWGVLDNVSQAMNAYHRMLEAASPVIYDSGRVNDMNTTAPRDAVSDSMTTTSVSSVATATSGGVSPSSVTGAGLAVLYDLYGLVVSALADGGVREMRRALRAVEYLLSKALGVVLSDGGEQGSGEV